MRAVAGVGLLALSLLAGQGEAAACSRAGRIPPPKVNWGSFGNDPKPPKKLFYRQENPDPEAVAKQAEAPLNRDGQSDAACPWNGPFIGAKRYWGDASTWPNRKVPTAGGVYLPKKTSVLVSACDFDGKTFSKIVIPEGSELIFLDQPMKLLMYWGFEVYGKFQMGSPRCRLQNKIEIELQPQLQSGGIVAKNKGTLDMHAWQYHYTWTRLAATVEAGSTFIYLQDYVNWEAGQQIAIATSVYKDLTEDENEVATIAGIHPTDPTGKRKGARIRLEKPLKFMHWGGSEYQSEVALLSRRIKIFTDEKRSAQRKIGSHMRCEGKNSNCRWSGVHADRLGQRNQMGFYPLHFHMMEDKPTSSINDCSCTNSYFRCIVVHGTNSTTVQRNTMFGVAGHSFYLEDGVEEHNKVQYNFAGRVSPIGKVAGGRGQGGETFYQRGEAVQPADASASGFYFSNPNNHIIGNAASGGWSGFAFPLLPKPIGQYQNHPMVPEQRPLGTFDGNTAHSAGFEWDGAGSCIYSGGDLRLINGKLKYSSGRNARDTKDDKGNPVWMKLTNTKVWMCRFGANTWGMRMTVRNYESHDCSRALQLFGESSLEKAWVQGRSKNPIAWKFDRFTDTVQGFRFYDIFVKSILDDILFTDFKATGESCIILGLTHSDVFQPFWISSVRRFRYRNVDQRIIHQRRIQEVGSSWKFNFVDFDGSATMLKPGTCNPTIVGADPTWWQVPGSVFNEDWQTWLTPKKPGLAVAGLDFLIPGRCKSYQGCMDFRGTPPDYRLTPSQKAQLDLGAIYQFGDKTKTLPLRRHTMESGISGGNGWHPWFKYGTPKRFTMLPVQIAPDSFVIVAFRYNRCYNFQINMLTWHARIVFSLTQARNKWEVINGDGSNYFCENNGGGRAFLYIKAINMYDEWPGAFMSSTKTSYVPNGLKGSGYLTNWFQQYDIRALNGGNAPDRFNDVFLPARVAPAIKTCANFDPRNPLSSKWQTKVRDPKLAADVFPYRWGCAPDLRCAIPGNPPKMCWGEGAMCNDNNPNTVMDKCTRGVCRGTPGKGPVVDRDLKSTSFYVAINIMPSVAVKAAVVQDMWGTQAQMRKQDQTTWVGAPKVAILGDVTLTLTFKDGSTQKYPFPDWNGVKSKPMTYTLLPAASRNRNWFQFIPTPADYVTELVFWSSTNPRKTATIKRGPRARFTMTSAAAGFYFNSGSLMGKFKFHPSSGMKDQAVNFGPYAKEGLDEGAGLANSSAGELNAGAGHRSKVAFLGFVGAAVAALAVLVAVVQRRRRSMGVVETVEANLIEIEME